MIPAIKKTMDAVEALLKVLVTAALISFTLLVAVQVAARYVFNSPLPWSEQAAR